MINISILRRHNTKRIFLQIRPRFYVEIAECGVLSVLFIKI